MRDIFWFTLTGLSALLIGRIIATEINKRMINKLPNYSVID